MQFIQKKADKEEKGNYEEMGRIENKQQGEKFIHNHIIIFIVNDLNIKIQRQRLIGWIKTQEPTL